MTGSQKDSTHASVLVFVKLADEVAHSWSRKVSVLANNHMAYSVSRSNLKDFAHCNIIPEAAISGHYELGWVRPLFLRK
jgi:hypothetical protein